MEASKEDPRLASCEFRFNDKFFVFLFKWKELNFLECFGE